MCTLAGTAGDAGSMGIHLSNLGSSLGVVLQPYYSVVVAMSSDEESTAAGIGLDGLASNASSPAGSSGLGELAASDASNDSDGPVPL